MSDDVAIKVENVNKVFKLPHEKQTSVKSALIHWIRGGRRSFEAQQVLKGISLEIKKGEFFGIVGRNGSGKSTLLKMLAGIYTPTGGNIRVNGKLTPFIELGVGFNPELTGRENVFLNGALLGFNRKEMLAMYDDIVAFAELEKFMDQKLKNYSSGMQVRLAFSIAIRADTDILVLDEVLAVGDEAFQKKCFEYFGKIKQQNKTVVLVTHDMNAVENFCSRAMLIADGEVKIIGAPPKVAASYLIENARSFRRQDTNGQGEETPDAGVRIKKVSILKGDKEITSFKQQDTITIELHYEVSEEQEVSFGVSFRKMDDTMVAAMGSTKSPGLMHLPKGKGVMYCDVPASQFIKDAYKVNVSLWSPSRNLLDYRDSTMGSVVPIIYVLDNIPARSGLFALNGRWKKG